MSPGVIPTGISDHNLVYAIRNLKPPKFKPTLKEVRDFKHFSETQFWNDLLLRSTGLLLQRRSKANFFHNGFEDCVKTKNIKKSWALIKSLTRKNNKFSNITEISTNDSNIVNPAQIAECFNDYFVNIGSLFGISGIQLK